MLSFEFCASFLSNHEQLVVVFWHERKSISDTAKISMEFNTCNFDELLVKIICDALRDLVPFVQFKNVKNIHGEVSLLVKLQAFVVPQKVLWGPNLLRHHKSLQLYQK